MDTKSAAAVMGKLGGAKTGPSKGRSAQLKAWWQSAGTAERKARIARMTRGRSKVKAS